ncbi:MAG: glycosyltransferase family 2 protein [Paracoccaceae bacterium]
MLNIGICTRERPKMLAELLESLCISIAQAGETVEIILIENGPPTGAKDVAESFADRLNISYHNEPRLGLVYARNAVVTQFLAGESEWIALVDDDEVVAPDWLSVFLQARADFPDADLLVGPTLKIYDPSAPRILRAARPKFHPHGHKVFRSGTNNCLMRREIFDDGEKLHLFDLAYNLTGGEDFDFFRRIRLRGYTCRYFKSALTYEHVPESRQSLRFQFSKIGHQAHCSGIVTINHMGRFAGSLFVLREILRDVTKGVVFGLIGVFILVVSEQRGLRLLARAWVAVASAIGRPRVFWSRPSESYATVQGQ